MYALDVPCPRCGSVEVVVAGRAEPPSGSDWAGEGAGAHVPLVHLCHCRNCRHSFQHDFAFGR